MQRRTLRAVLLAALVPVSSFFGLFRPMLETGWNVYAEVWAASLWGDLVFTVGTLAAGWAVAVALGRMRGTRSGILGVAWAAPLAFLLHWLVYVLSWSLTGSVGEGSRFLSFSFAGFGRAWGFTLEWGWPGLLACAAAPWAVARLERWGAAGASAPTASAA